MERGTAAVLRRRARGSLTRFAAVSGVLSRFERRMRQGWTILTYHRVLEDPAAYPFPSLVTPLDTFALQMRWVAECCEALPVREALVRSRAGAPAERPLVSITIDDGYADGAALIAPILHELGLRATFFITTGPVGTRERLWFDLAARRILAAPSHDLAAAIAAHIPPPAAPPTLRAWMRMLKDLPPAERSRFLRALPPAPAEEASDADRLMRPDEVADLARRGHEIAAHTITHPILPQLDEAALARELRVPREQLAAWTGAAPTGLCYPNGDHDARVVEAARAAGYAYACATLAGRNPPDADPFRLRRVDMNPDRTVRRDGSHDHLAFRAQVSLLHEAMR